MIEIRNLSKKYGAKIALEGINLDIKPGEIIGLFGENGAGKTTLIKCILNLLEFRGEVLLDGEPVSRKNVERLSFATVEHSFFPNLDGRTHREFYQDHFEGFRGKRFDGLVEFFGLPMDRPLGKLSTGQQNQFEVILALCQGADYILMDEPFSGSDVFNREDFYKVLMGILEPQETILLSTHMIDEVADIISRTVLIHHGHLIGDVQTEQLQQEGISLMDYVRDNYHYEADRVSKALDRITGSEEDHA